MLMFCHERVRCVLHSDICFRFSAEWIAGNNPPHVSACRFVTDSGPGPRESALQWCISIFVSAHPKTAHLDADDEWLVETTHPFIYPQIFATLCAWFVFPLQLEKTRLYFSASRRLFQSPRCTAK
uniref:Uncharacterized protein n=1 Tax=Phlegmariurus squarrosus TaxID=73615 RepID=H9M8B9_PHLSQ|nr:hypothetical protein HusqMp64 [Phlegmariurus squarrosus]AEV55826.1 hypothetical protein HusqMp64 [Phlegmariurus squarrosus]